MVTANESLHLVDAQNFISTGLSIVRRAVRNRKVPDRRLGGRRVPVAVKRERTFR